LKLKNIPKLLVQFLQEFAGSFAVASLLICAFSGAFLTVSYDSSHAYLSVTTLVTANPAASFIRNIHYWSAQLFLIFTILHAIENLLRSGELKIKSGSVWLRLVFSVIVAWYAMVSGFILKADPDSEQAQRILTSLLESIPVAGAGLRLMLAGSEGSFQLVYIQHAATATFLLIVLIAGHTRGLKVKSWIGLTVILAVIFLSFALRAPLGTENIAGVKGPWYFIGLQEMLHWLGKPSQALLVMVVLLLIFASIYFIKNKYTTLAKYLLFSLLIAYSLLTITGTFYRSSSWNWQWPFTTNYQKPLLLQAESIAFFTPDSLKLQTIHHRAEGCLSCHSGMKGFAGAHDPGKIGCYTCHGGDPFSLNKQKAHRNMVIVPGNLSNAMQTCGSNGCHTSIVPRVEHSLMSSLSGMITVDKWTFGEINDLETQSHVNQLGYSAADVHLRNLCAGCHLGNTKTIPGSPEWLQRGGGCNACHLNYGIQAAKSFNLLKTNNKNLEMVPEYHPEISIQVDNSKCKSCHSRSGRISMNYEGWHETAISANKLVVSDSLMILPDRRVFKKIVPDVHHQSGMWCIDCHGSYELMGDGKHYTHKEDAVKVQCADCHQYNVDNFKSSSLLDRESQLIIWLRKYPTANLNVITTQKDNLPLVNTKVQSGNILKLIRKSDNKELIIKQLSVKCYQGKAHDRLACDACHSGWAPQCIGCHTSYDKTAAGFDMITNKTSKGGWVEQSSEGVAELPALGVIGSKSGGKSVIGTFVPGMIMTIDKNSFREGSGKIFRRLYAPASAHTTTVKARTCVTCHNNPLALGYGRGILNYSITGKWTFDALYENNPVDGLPHDAWIPFLGERRDQATTRKNMRPFSLNEQKKILTVGACLTCHKESSAVMQQALNDFARTISLRSNKCKLPVW
jgi:quinol-cytochrome oxidoreductase complex cytochrome b subunit